MSRALIETLAAPATELKGGSRGTGWAFGIVATHNPLRFFGVWRDETANLRAAVPDSYMRMCSSASSCPTQLGKGDFGENRLNALRKLTTAYSRMELKAPASRDRRETRCKAIS